MTKDQIIDKLYWLVYYLLQESGEVYRNIQTIDELIYQVYDVDRIKEYPDYELTCKNLARIDHKFDLYEKQFKDIDKALKELAD
jgi:hypothetical protein